MAEPHEASRPGPLWPTAVTPLAAPLLERYLAFVGLERPALPSRTALAALQTAHLHAIPFENLDAYLGRPVSLEHEALAAKMLGGERGGYCFEHNVLFAAALTALGFQVERMAARIVLGQVRPRPRTHLALRVVIDGAPILADVGFGRTSLRGPIAMEPGLVQRLVDHDVRLVEVDGELLVEARPVADGGGWEGLYLIDPRPEYEADALMGNHWVSTHPDSTMKERVMVLLPSAHGRRSIGGTGLTIDEPGRREQRDLAADELGAVLLAEFGIRLPVPVDRLER